MGTILPRKRKDGSTGYTAIIRIKKAGKVIHSETQTFDRDQAARNWMKKRETELAEPGALVKVPDPLLSDVIDQYTRENLRTHGKTKAQVLRTIKGFPISQLRCSEIDSPALVAFAKSVPGAPSTRGNYLSHLSPVFTVAKPAWGYPLSAQAMDDARVVLRKLGLLARSEERTRRPTLEELNKLMAHYAITDVQRADSIPMQRLIAFAIFSTRRQEEICRVVWEDLDRTHQELIVRDMKNPGQTKGNDVITKLTPEALQLIEQREGLRAVDPPPRPSRSSPPGKRGQADNRIWPFNAESVSASFTRACKMLEIEDLTFHDLRHEGISRLFELGWTIPQVATVSGHRSWASLKRYAHLKQTGDKFAGWTWLAKLGVSAISC